MFFNRKLLKTHKPSINSSEYKSTILKQGRYGIKFKEKGWLTLEQIRAIRQFFRRFFKKKLGSLWVRIFPERFKTKKSLGSARMGKGKGALDCQMYYVKKGQILFEVYVKNLKYDFFLLRLLKQCQHKLPFLTKIFRYLKIFK